VLFKFKFKYAHVEQDNFEVMYSAHFGSACSYIIPIKCTYQIRKGKGKGKAVPIQVWSGPEGPRKLRFPDFMTTAQDGGKVVSLKHRPHLPPGNTTGTHFC
jgi:hypothetical protein